MVGSASEYSKHRLVLLTSIGTSIALVVFFLFGAISTNAIREGAAYTQVDMIAGSIFVLVLSMIISLSLWPKIIDRFENKGK